MNKMERAIFTNKVDKIFGVMHDDSYVVINGIKQLDNTSVIHDLKFLKYNDDDEKYRVYKILHRVYWNDDFHAREDYLYFPKRINKFHAVDYIFYEVRLKLFDRWSKLDMNDMFTKLDLKLVELI